MYFPAPWSSVETPFLLGSINKLFTGLAVGQLVEQGKLGYDDPLSKFLPDFPNPESAKKIKIKHLLSHTSGLSGDIFGPALEQSIDKLTSAQAYIDIAERQPLHFEPEERVRAGWSEERLVSTAAKRRRSRRADGISIRLWMGEGIPVLSREPTWEGLPPRRARG